MVIAAPSNRGHLRETRELLRGELKRRLAQILRFEKHSDDTDWTAVSTLSAELLRDLPEPALPFITEYLTRSDTRKTSASLARRKHLKIVRYLRSDEYR